jgi:long-chain fatty acid transport protein
MKKVMLKTTISLAVAMASTQIFASGFALNEQSISGMGTGFAGRSSSADDASTLVGNPAGMSRLKREQVTGGVAFIDAHTDISDASSSNGGTNKGDMVPFMGVPMGYYVKPIDDQWAVGFGVYAPFGLVTDYENGFAGRYFGSKSEVKIITLQPTVSYAFNEKVSIGFGPTINRIDGKLESNLSLSPNPAAPDGEVKIKGDDTALGYNIGILVQATDSTRVGLTYHSKVKYKLDGDTKLDYSVLGPLGQQKFDASLDITTPESVDFSVTHQLDDQWTLYAGSTWTRWSRLKEISVENEGVPAPLAARGFGTITEEQNWHDTWAHAIGASYQLNKQWVLRTGLSVDQAPTNNENRSPRIPTGDRTIFSLGAGWSPTDDLTIDVAYSYLREESVKVNDSNGRQSYSSKYENWANGFGVGATYRF